MKIGSVKFFKRLIIGVVIFLLTLPLVLAVLFGVLYTKQKKLAEDLEAINWALANDTSLPEDVQLSPDLPTYVQLPTPDNKVSIPASFDYQKKYPQLYVERPQTRATEGKVCYLTFDDGPSPVTRQVLQTLAEQDVKATFFVTGKNSEENQDILREAAAAGHTIGVHTWSHEYGEIYASVDAFLEDFEKMFTYIKEVTGTAPSVFRFAGGSVNVYNQQVYGEIIAEMVRRGFVFFDWNAAASDAKEGGITRNEAVRNVLDSAAGRQRAVVLMHDRHDNGPTAAALPAIIDGLREQGYAFAPLNATVQPITFFCLE